MGNTKRRCPTFSRTLTRANLTGAVGTPLESGVETGNLVQIQNCPAAVSRNESLNIHALAGKSWEAEASRNPETEAPASPNTCQ
jgi:hypothetical protein